jgi:hypothetical protein
MLAAMSDNLLARIPGQYAARALQTLPRAETAADELMEATIDVPGVGRVRITAKRFKHKRGKAVSYFWTAEKALCESTS